MKIPRMSRLMRRHLIQLGRRTGDPATAIRFLVVARLGLGHRRSTRRGRSRRGAFDCRKGSLPFRAPRSRRTPTTSAAATARRRSTTRFRRRVAQLLRRTPEDFGWSRPTWTRELLCLQMQRDGRPAVAVCTMGPCARIDRREARHAEARRTLPVAAERPTARSRRDPSARSACERRRGRCSTAMRSTSISTRSSDATGCSAAISAAS
jgi:hypothetical protein